MIRIATLAAVAGLMIAAPANAHSLRISTVGKSPEQLHAEIVKAAKTVCARATVGASFPREMMQTCMKAAVSRAVAQTRNPDIAAIPTRLAWR